MFVSDFYCGDAVFMVNCLHGDFMRENFPIRYDYFRERLIKKDDICEINFSITGNNDYQNCWMGYSDDEDCYWFGLSDAKQSYDYKTADDILNAKVFDGKSMCELWDKVEFYTVNGVSSHTWVWRRCWNIYTAREKDYEKIAQLACELWPHHSIDEMCDEIKEIIASDNDMIFTLYCYGEMVGFAHCSIRNNYVEGTHSNPIGYLEGIYIKEEWRKLGFATELISCCENWAKSKGCKEFASDCDISNNESIKLHKSSGFNEVSRLVHFVKEI